MKIRHLLPFLLLMGCVHEAAIPLNSDTMEIDVSAAPIYGRSGAQRIALDNAAKATVDAGYDKFIVLKNGGWNENGAIAASYNQSAAQANDNQFSAQASGGSFFQVLRHPEATMVIKMFHYDDKGADKAIDAHAILKKNADQSSHN